MPGAERRDRRQKAVLWMRAGSDAYGQPKVGAPVEIDVRWKDTKQEVVDPTGNTVTIDATVIVDRYIPIGSAMWKGTLASLGNPPTPPADVMEVKKYDETPDIKNRIRHREVSLMRSKDVLPTLN